MTHQRKLFRIIVPILVICLIGWLANASLDRLRTKEKSKKLLAHFPSLNLSDIETGRFLNLDNYGSKSILLVYFNSECSLCHEQTTALANSLNQLPHAVVVFASAQSLTEILRFRNQYKLISIDNVKFCQVQDLEDALFTLGAVPQFYIYNSHHELVRAFQGKTKIETLVKTIQLP